MCLCSPIKSIEHILCVAAIASHIHFLARRRDRIVTCTCRSCYDSPVYQLRLTHPFHHTRKHRPATHIRQSFSRKARRAHSRLNYCEIHAGTALAVEITTPVRGRIFGAKHNFHQLHSLANIQRRSTPAFDTIQKMLHFIHVHLIDFPAFRQSKGNPMSCHAVEPPNFWTVEIPKNRARFAHNLAAPLITSLHIIKMNFRDRSANMPKHHCDHVFRIDFQRAQVPCHAAHLLNFPQIPARQIDFVNTIQNASPAGFLLGGIVLAVICAGTPSRQVGTDMDSRKKNPS